MIYLYAALLLHEAEKEIDEINIKQILESVDITVDENRVKVLVDCLKDVNINEILEQMKVAPPPQVTEPSKEEPKEEQEVEEEKDEMSGLGKLFG